MTTNNDRIQAYQLYPSDRLCRCAHCQSVWRYSHSADDTVPTSCPWCDDEYYAIMALEDSPFEVKDGKLGPAVAALRGAYDKAVEDAKRWQFYRRMALKKPSALAKLLAPSQTEGHLDSILDVLIKEDDRRP